MKLNKVLIITFILIFTSYINEVYANNAIYHQSLSMGNDDIEYTPQSYDSYYIDVPTDDTYDKEEEEYEPQQYWTYPYPYPYYYGYNSGYSITVPGLWAGRGTRIYRNPNAHGYDYGGFHNRPHKPNHPPKPNPPSKPNLPSKPPQGGGQPNQGGHHHGSFYH